MGYGNHQNLPRQASLRACLVKYFLTFMIQKLRQTTARMMKLLAEKPKTLMKGLSYVFGAECVMSVYCNLTLLIR